MCEMESQLAKKSNPIFKDLSGDDPEPETTVIESLCVNCGKNGTTRLLLTRIPHYKDVILMSFDCESCGFANNEIQRGGKTNEKGIKIELKVSSSKDFNRQVIKSDYTSVKIPELNFEIPSQSQKGEITTVEGILKRTIDGLKQDQDARRQEDPEVAANIDIFIAKLQSLFVDETFTMIFEDISGECHVENPNAPLKDPNCNVSYFWRSDEQNKILGIYPENSSTSNILQPIEEIEEKFPLEDLEGEVLQFPTNCPECNCPCTTNMKMTDIPHFKQVVIMATNCDSCGHRTNEVKGGGGIEPQGVRIKVLVHGSDDFSRDVLKSETCALEIPELELEVGPAAISGRFTTIEGLLNALKEDLSNNTILTGDSSDKVTQDRMKEFIAKIDDVLSGNRVITIVLDDAAGNSYVQSLSDDGCDDRLTITKYDRNFQQNEELGLNDMKVQDY